MNKILEFFKKNINFENLKKDLSFLEKSLGEKTFWDEKNKEIIERISYIKKLLNDWQEIEKNPHDKGKVLNFFFNYLLQDKYDKNFAFLNIYSGTGGKDAEDWVGILKRMYQKFFQRMKWNYSLIDEDPNEFGGYKFVSFEIQEKYSYGILKFEKGVHRLVRISPFSPQKLRHTSFAYVEVIPAIETPSFQIKEEDLEIQTFRAGGPGGQNVNKVETAIRIIYKPLNIVVTCQKERSQHRNREIALQILYSKIQNLLEEKKKKEIEELRGQKIEISWGHQKRNYIFDPYKLIKDLETKKEVKNIDEVLDGKIELLHPYQEILEFMLK